VGSTWKTKYGMRRVRIDPPTLEEALYAAEGMTRNFQEQVQIAAELMHLSVDQVQAEGQRIIRQKTRTIQPMHNSGPVIVDRKPARRFASRR
jgi:hypothetical protein